MVNKKHIIFVADPNRRVKNYKLVKETLKYICSDTYELNIVYDISHDMIPMYLNSSDLLILTSYWEGSPNIVKEAMACNLPIVSTDVGDVKEVIDHTEGCFIVSFDPFEISEKLKIALKFENRTSGREKVRIFNENIIAKKIISLYLSALNKKRKNFENHN